MTPAQQLYTTANYPRFVMNHGNWDIYANDAGNCAAIPTAKALADGCKATHFGDLNYVRITLRRDAEAQGIDLNAFIREFHAAA